MMRKTPVAPQPPPGFLWRPRYQFIVEARSAGWTYAQIAAPLGVTKARVGAMVKEARQHLSRTLWTPDEKAALEAWIRQYELEAVLETESHPPSR